MKISRRGTILGLAGVLALLVGVAVAQGRSWLPSPAPEMAQMLEMMDSSGHRTGDWLVNYGPIPDKPGAPLYAIALNSRTGEKYQSVLPKREKDTFFRAANISRDGQQIAIVLKRFGKPGEEFGCGNQAFLLRRGQEKPLPLEANCFSEATFSTDNRSLYTWNGKVLAMSDTATGHLKNQWKVDVKLPRYHAEPVLTENGELLMLDREVKDHWLLHNILWRFSSKTNHLSRLQILPLPVNSGIAVGLSPSGDFLVGMVGDRIWDAHTGELCPQPVTGWSGIGAQDLLPPVLFSPDETSFAVVRNKGICLYETRTGKFLRQLPLPSGHLLRWCFSPDAATLYVQAVDNLERGPARVTAQRAR